MQRECLCCHNTFEDYDPENNSIRLKTICVSCEDIYQNIRNIHCKVCDKATPAHLMNQNWMVACKECGTVYLFWYVPTNTVAVMPQIRKLEVV